jgi:hypothetical protein
MKNPSPSITAEGPDDGATDSGSQVRSDSSCCPVDRSRPDPEATFVIPHELTPAPVEVFDVRLASLLLLQQSV